MSLDVPRPKGYRKGWSGPRPTTAQMALDLAWTAYLHFAPTEARVIQRKEDMDERAQKIWQRIGRRAIQSGEWDGQLKRREK